MGGEQRNEKKKEFNEAMRERSEEIEKCRARKREDKEKERG